MRPHLIPIRMLHSRRVRAPVHATVKCQLTVVSMVTVKSPRIERALPAEGGTYELTWEGRRLTLASTASIDAWGILWLLCMAWCSHVYWSMVIECSRVRKRHMWFEDSDWMELFGTTCWFPLPGVCHVSTWKCMIKTCMIRRWSENVNAQLVS